MEAPSDRVCCLRLRRVVPGVVPPPDGPEGNTQSVRCARHMRQVSEDASDWHRDLRFLHGRHAGWRWDLYGRSFEVVCCMVGVKGASLCRNSAGCPRHKRE